MDPVLKKNFSYLFLLQIANSVILLILLSYLTHTLGVDNFGKITFVQSFVTYFILLTDFGFNISSTQRIVKIRNNKEELSKIYWSTTMTKLIFAFVSFIIFALLLIGIPKLRELSLLLIIAFGGVISTVLFPLWLFQGLEKMSYITWFNVIPKLLVLVLTLLLVKQHTDYVLALILQTTGPFLTAIASIFFISNRKLINIYIPNFNDIRSTVIEAWHLFITGVATNIYTTTNTVVLGFLSNDTIVGLFSASEKIIRAIIILFSSISQVTFPRINSYYHQSKELALVFGGKILKYAAMATFLTGLLLLLTAPLIVKILFGLPQYAETIVIMRICSFLPFFAICNGVLAVNLLITFGLKRYLTRIVVTGGIFSLLFVVPSVLLYQARGVALVAILTEILITILLLYVLKKHNVKIIL